MKLATVFSGIGAIEQALIRLGIDYDIAFACDNGDVELNLLEGNELEEYTSLKKLRSKKQLRNENDIKRLEELGKKENDIAESIRKPLNRSSILTRINHSEKTLNRLPLKLWR